MLPLVEIPDTIGRRLAPYRTLFCREAGFEHICRYISGLILSPNKTLQGIYDLQVWADDHTPSRRAMHEAVFEAGWASEALMPRHREVVDVLPALKDGASTAVFPSPIEGSGSTWV